jgi:hypothetical protein
LGFDAGIEPEVGNMDGQRSLLFGSMEFEFGFAAPDEAGTLPVLLETPPRSFH